MIIWHISLHLKIPKYEIMYQLSVAPDQVNQTLQQHILADGFDLTYDMEKSNGAYIYDSKYNRNLLDFFTCFASVATP
mgnify:FL=1